MTFDLFEAYPRLENALPRLVLCQLPTPIKRLDSIKETAVFVKRDDITAPDFGGNKVRALEFLLGAAQHRQIPRAFVAGLAGTSMALASALYAKKHNVNLAVVLIPQRPTEEARRNLLIFQCIGAELHTVSNVPGIFLTFGRIMLGGLLRYRRPSFMLNPNSPLGMTGYLNMGYELRHQIEQGEVPEPDRLYIPMGLRGTATGLLTGLRAAGLKTRLVAVTHPGVDITKTKANILKNVHKLNVFLRERDSSFPQVNLQADDFDVVSDDSGQKSSNLISEGMEQFETVWQTDGIRLDATWTASTWAAMRRDVMAGKTGNVLFWHTYNTQPTPVDIEGLDYHQLPKAFHYYFEDPVTLVNKPIFVKD